MNVATLSHTHTATVQPTPLPPSASMVETAVTALRYWIGPDADRTDAEHWLAEWPLHKGLSDEDYAAVLNAFGPEPELVPGLDFLPPLTGSESTGLYPMPKPRFGGCHYVNDEYLPGDPRRSCAEDAVDDFDRLCAPHLTVVRGWRAVAS